MPTSLRFQIRGDTAEGWATKNPKLLNREIGYDSTTRRLKVGDGSKLWNDLAFLPPDVIDDLTTGGSGNALSAEQGKVLKGLVDTNASTLSELEERINDVASNGVTVRDDFTHAEANTALSAGRGKVLYETKADKSALTTAVTNLTTQINTKASTTQLTNVETTLRSLINGSKVTVENVLTSTSTVNALSANQGRILKGLIDSSRVTVINNLTTNNTTAALSAAQGRVLKGLIDALTSSKVIVENNLTSTSAVNALSANQGRILKGLIDSSKVTVVNNLTTNNATAALSAAQGQVLKGLIDSSKVTVINNLTTNNTTAALSAAQGKKLNDDLAAIKSKNFRTVTIYTQNVGNGNSYGYNSNDQKNPTHTTLIRKITIPDGVKYVYLSGCGGGGGLGLYQQLLTSGWTAAWVWRYEVQVNKNDVLTLKPGLGGKGITSLSEINAVTSTNKICSRGQDSVVLLNDREILRLAGGKSGANAHAGNQTGESTSTGVLRCNPMFASESILLGYNYDSDGRWKLLPTNTSSPLGDLYQYLRRHVNAMSAPQSMFSPYGVGGTLFNGGHGMIGFLMLEYTVSI